MSNCAKCRFYSPGESLEPLPNLAPALDGDCLCRPPTLVLVPMSGGQLISSAFPRVCSWYTCGSFAAAEGVSPTPVNLGDILREGAALREDEVVDPAVRFLRSIGQGHLVDEALADAAAKAAREADDLVPEGVVG